MNLFLFFLFTLLGPSPGWPDDACPSAYQTLAPVHLRGEELVKDTYARIESLRSQKLPYVNVEQLGLADGNPIYQVHVRSTAAKPLRVFISSGVHGREPEAVTTGMSLLDEAVASPDFRAHYDFTYVPMVNPGGLALIQRDNLKGLDINRSFAEGRWTEVSTLIRDKDGAGKFDVSVDLHGAEGKHQFFLIRAEDDQGLSEKILKDVPPSLLLPSTGGTYPGFAPAFDDLKRYTMDSPGAAISRNEGTLKSFMASEGVPRSYTLEYPGLLDFDTQQKWNLRIVEEILRQTDLEKKSALVAPTR